MSFSAIGRRLGAGAAAGAAAAASQPAAQARAPPQVAPNNPASFRHVKPLHEDEDGWMELEYDSELLLFKPFSPEDVERARGELGHMLGISGPEPAVRPESQLGFQGPVDPLGGHPLSPPGLTSGDSDSSSTSGSDADLIIASTQVATGAGASGVLGAHHTELNDLLMLTTRFLRSPGLQREIVKVMLEDEPAREMLLRRAQEKNLDAYLASVGIAPVHMLTGPSSSVTITEVQDGEEDAASASGGDGKGFNLLHAVTEAVAKVVATTESALAGLGGWLRDTVGGLSAKVAEALGVAPPAAAAAADAHEAKGRKAAGAKGGRAPQGQGQGQGSQGGDKVLGAVVVLAVAMLVMLVMRRPIVMRGLRRA